MDIHFFIIPFGFKYKGMIKNDDVRFIIKRINLFRGNIMKIRLLQVKEAKGVKILTSQSIAELMREEAKADRECFWVLHLNCHFKLIEKELVHMGSLNASLAHPREIFKKAIINSAHGIITVHNHPAGDNQPSREDKKIWKRINEGGEILGIEVLDHIIITPCGGYYSALDNGDMLEHKVEYSLH